MCVWTGGGVIFWTRCWEIDVVWTGGRWTCVYVFCIWGGVIDMHSFEDFFEFSKQSFAFDAKCFSLLLLLLMLKVRVISHGLLFYPELKLE